MLLPSSNSKTAVGAGAAEITVAAAQLATTPGDLERNTDRHLALIHEARTLGVDCLLFPELSLTGPLGSMAVSDVALDAEHPMVRALVKAAGPMVVTFGMVEEGPAAQFYNTAYTAGGGRLLHLHRKINLNAVGPFPDRAELAGGRYVDAFALSRRWRAASLLSNDLWNPALTHIAALHGATLLLVAVRCPQDSAATPFDTLPAFSLACRHAAMVYGLPVVFANLVGEVDGVSFAGGSTVLGATGETLAMAGGTEGLSVATISYHAVRTARSMLPTVRDSNLDLIEREIRRLNGRLGVPQTVRSG